MKVKKLIAGSLATAMVIPMMAVHSFAAEDGLSLSSVKDS